MTSEVYHTVGRNERKIAEYARNRLEEDKQWEQLKMKERIEPFTGEPVKKDK